MAKLVEWEEHGGVAETGQLHLDPICGRRVREPANLSAEYKQRKYYFCSENCRGRFHERTEKFRVTELARAGALLSPGKVRWGLS
jgi:YHS domain-containing protein